MSSLEQVKADIQDLPEEAQALLIDFIEILKKRYGRADPESGATKTATRPQDIPDGKASSQSSEVTHQPLDLTNSAFVGMWKDRADMQDSTGWVRQQRQQQWRG